ncbi:MAG: hypothetical protein JXQ90_21110 [Cyclobacteriaceae bacterium]
MSNLKITSHLDQHLDLAKLSSMKSVVPFNERKFGYYLWTFKVSDKSNEVAAVGLYHDNLMRMLHVLGYRRMKETGQVIRSYDGIIEEVDVIKIKKHVLAVVDQFDQEITFEEYSGVIRVEELREIFLRQQNSPFGSKNSLIDFLSDLDESILDDTNDASYIPFQNGVVEVTSNGVSLLDYSEISGQVVWKHQVIKRNFSENIDYNASSFASFITNIGNQDQQRVNQIRSAIGYLLHSHNSLTKTFAIYLMDEEALGSEDPQGGAGKGILANGIGQIRVVVDLDGKRFNGNNRFLFQQVELSTQIIHLDDVKPNFDPDTLNAVLSAGLVSEQKGKDPVKFPKEKSPKIIVTSNAGVKSGGTTRKRRQVFVLIGNHYSRLTRSGVSEPIVHVHGHRFFSEDWTDRDWQMFDAYMIDSLFLYMKKGVSSIDDESIKWINLQSETSVEFCVFVNDLDLNVVYDSKEKYQEFLLATGWDSSELSQRSFSMQLKKYATVFDLNYENKSSNGSTTFSIKQQENH